LTVSKHRSITVRDSYALHAGPRSAPDHGHWGGRNEQAALDRIREILGITLLLIRRQKLTGTGLPRHPTMGASVRYRDDLIPVPALEQEGLAYVHRVIQFLRSGSFPDSEVIEPERFENKSSG
jgi:hypothetical protein